MAGDSEVGCRRTPEGMTMTMTSKLLLGIGSALFLENLYIAAKWVAREHPGFSTWRFGVIGCIAVALVSLYVFRAVRTAKCLSTDPVEKSQQAIFGLTFFGLVLASLALQLPRLLSF